MFKLLKVLSLTILVLLIPIQPVNAKVSKSIDIKFTQESVSQLNYEMGINSPYKGQFLTYTVDDDNNIIRIDNLYSRSSLIISVFVGGAIVGYLTSIVIDGIVIAATGQSGAWWVSQAIVQVLNKQYSATTSINCDVYPPNSYAGAMCRAT